MADIKIITDIKSVVFSLPYNENAINSLIVLSEENHCSIEILKYKHIEDGDESSFSSIKITTDNPTNYKVFISIKGEKCFVNFIIHLLKTQSYSLGVNYKCEKVK